MSGTGRGYKGPQPANMLCTNVYNSVGQNPPQLVHEKNNACSMDVCLLIHTISQTIIDVGHDPSKRLLYIRCPPRI